MSSEDRTFFGYAAKTPGLKVEPFEYKLPAQPQAGFVDIEITHAGICHSDIHTIKGEWGPWRQPEVIVGHEIVGTIVRVGDNVTSLAVGDRVAVGAQVGSCLKMSCQACRTDNDQHCPSGVFTYNAVHPDGTPAYGGYQKVTRVPDSHVFKLPAEIPSDVGAPLMCAGATVYSPLARWDAGRTRKRVGVVGFGGLGHLAVAFAAKMGADVTVISTSTSKKDDAMSLGATRFLVSKNEAEMNAAANSLDLIINTVSDLVDLAPLINLLGLDGVLVQIGAPVTPLPVGAFSLLMKRVIVTGSLIGSRKEINDMLAFSAKYKVFPIIEKSPMAQVNEALQKVHDNKCRYRFVLEN